MKKKKMGYQSDKCYKKMNFRKLEDKFVISEKVKVQAAIFGNLGINLSCLKIQGLIYKFR